MFLNNVSKFTCLCQFDVYYMLHACNDLSCIIIQCLKYVVLLRCTVYVLLSRLKCIEEYMVHIALIETKSLQKVNILFPDLSRCCHLINSNRSLGDYDSVMVVQLVRQNLQISSWSYNDKDDNFKWGRAVRLQAIFQSQQYVEMKVTKAQHTGV